MLHRRKRKSRRNNRFHSCFSSKDIKAPTHGNTLQHTVPHRDTLQHIFRRETFKARKTPSRFSFTHTHKYTQTLPGANVR
mmetsp:Transcript_30040/g.48416  ORF Transcript_30040/g.48416 Transcript_30040/m.48416 type:complete len:80 (+) Transcript_30040:1433-1672(+)